MFRLLIEVIAIDKSEKKELCMWLSRNHLTELNGGHHVLIIWINWDFFDASPGLDGGGNKKKNKITSYRIFLGNANSHFEFLGHKYLVSRVNKLSLKHRDKK